MIVIDSSLWLEYFVNSENSKIIENLLDNPETIIVPTIILTEIYKKLLKEWNQTVADDLIVQFQDYKINNLEFRNSLQAAKIGSEYKLPLADSIIYETTIKYGAILYTLDKHFEGLPNVKYFEKN